MLVVWYIWRRFFWFVSTETTPWPFVRYRVYRVFFNNIFTYNQLNFFQKKILNWFYIYLYFLPMSSNFANNYFFTFNRNYFGGFGYKMISYEGANQFRGETLETLADFSDEVNLVKQINFCQSLSIFDLTIFLKYITYKYYFSYYVFYLKSFYEFEPLDFKNIKPYSLYLSTCLSYVNSTTLNVNMYNLNTVAGFFNFLSNSSFETFFSTTPKLPTFNSSVDNYIENYYKKLHILRNRYTNLYKRVHVNSFFFGSANLSKLLIAKFQPSSYITLNLNWATNLKKILYVRFSESSVSKYISLNTQNNYKIYYIRKNRIFNKGRYSRNRQLYRTGFYWCLWVNVVAVYGLYFFFYRFMFNFGYLWIGIAILAFSFIFARVCQARFYNFRILLNEFVLFWNWICVLFTNFYGYLYNNYLISFSFYIYNIYANLIVNGIIPLIYTTYLYKVFLFFSEETRKVKSARFVFYWEYFVGEDKSFLKIKSKIHWLKQLWKMLTH